MRSDLPIDEIDELCSGSWVLVRVTAFNELRSPVRGKLILRGSRPKVMKALHELLSVSTPDGPYYIFPAGQLVSANKIGTAIARASVEDTARR
jgi:hypothetical protein